jgi:hypothetical protein
LEGGIDKAGAAKGDGACAAATGEESNNESGEANLSSSAGCAANCSASRSANSAAKGGSNKDGIYKRPSKEEGYFQQFVRYMNDDSDLRLFVLYKRVMKIHF